MRSIRRHALPVLAVTLALAAAPPAAAGYADAPVSSATVVVPMVFPVVGRVSFSDTFLACRSGCARKHFGQDLMGAKMLPLVAAFDGRVSSLKRETTVGGGNYVTVRGHNGWSANYVHVNNDTPGTDDGRGTARFAFAPGLDVGDQVFAGQLLGWLGDSGNSEGTAPHLHFELRQGDAWSGTVYNAYPSLVRAVRIPAPRRSGPHVDGLLVRSSASGPVSLLWQGRRRPVRGAALTARGWTSAHVLTISSNEERSYPLGPPVPLPDGRVYRDGAGALWLVAGARRYAVPSAAAAGVAEARVLPADAAALAATPVATTEPPAGPFREGALVRAVGNPTVYVVLGGRLRPVPDLGTFASWGLSFADVVDVPAALLAGETAPPAGLPLLVRDGTVVANKINRWFVVTGGTRRYVTPEVAKLFGYDVLPRPRPGEAAINRLPVGAPLP